MSQSMSTTLYRGQRVALIVPCYNEDPTIAGVINGFRAAMPCIDIYVFDNMSSDKTADIARAAGAQVRTVTLRGKGNVVRRMFADTEADVYVMVDGDGTYDASSVCRMVDKLLDEGLDMVVGCRETSAEEAHAAYRRGHQWGNKMLTGSVKGIFGGDFNDMLSGYRVFSRRYAKSFPALSRGFETETELTVHALELRMPYGELMTPYGSRPEGSASKLSTYRDGWRILKTIIRLHASERPIAFFGAWAAAFCIAALVLAFPLLIQYLEAGNVPRLPTAVLSASLMLMSMLALTCGLILQNITQGRHEMKCLAFLGIPATRADTTAGH
ncbi:glycosyltransferase [Variovorax atrisoli]|uniref:glycosyltransferase n=1 Tax=Variovorax atrisoli TaxID=3394203 RepID=UPI0040400327